MKDKLKFYITLIILCVVFFGSGFIYGNLFSGIDLINHKVSVTFNNAIQETASRTALETIEIISSQRAALIQQEALIGACEQLNCICEEL